MKRLFVVGLGPGGRDGMTLEAKKALEQSEVICGYTAYADLIREDYPEKEYLVSGMTKEVERCHMALLAAQDGKTTAMICSGDAGVYGMAGLVLSLAEKYPETEVVIVAGVTAALSGAARLGAPLMNDFAVISLSDLLTPKDVIEKRLRNAEGEMARADEYMFQVTNDDLGRAVLGKGELGMGVDVTANGGEFLVQRTSEFDDAHGCTVRRESVGVMSVVHALPAAESGTHPATVQHASPSEAQLRW